MKNALNPSDRERWQIAKEALESLEAEGLFEKTGEFRQSEITGELVPVYRSVPHAKAPFDTGELIDQLHQAAERFDNVMLVVGWAKERKVEFVYANETPSAGLHKLIAMVKRGGAPLGFIGFERNETSFDFYRNSFHPEEDVINNELLILAQEQIRAGLQRDGIIENSEN